MNPQIQNMFDKFNALNQRERISVMLLSLVAIVIIFTEFVLAPINKKHDIASTQLKSSVTQVKQLENQISALKVQKNRDPDFQLKQKLKLLNEQLGKVNTQLKEKMHGLIEPTQMAKVLEVVLTQNTDLKLERVQSLGAVPLAPINISEKKDAKAENLGIYRHGLQIEFKGSYLSTLKYLKALDELPWDFYWDVLELNVDEYPTSVITITVHTLSFHEGWIGV